MASAQPHPSFPTRPYASMFHGKLPERNTASAFGGPSNRPERAQQQQQQQHQQAPPPPDPLQTITDEQREEVNEAFALFDLDKDQRVDYHEFKVALKALGFDLPKPEILALLTTHGTPPADGARPQNAAPTAWNGLQLTLPAFQAVAARLISARDPRDEILRAFALFDTEDKGMISLEDLRRVARELGEGLEEEELVAMIEEFDLEGKGGVGREEFVAICMG